jgi:small-conductance mechanosensitive channel
MSDTLSTALQAPGVSIALRLGLVVLLALITLITLRVFARQVQRGLSKTSIDPERVDRLKTLVQIIHSILFIAVLIITVAMALQTLQINVAPLIAGAGIAGLALSLGAQTLIKDFIGGFLIFIENQFTVGDVISVGSVSGAVEEIGLRATRLRDFQGRLHIVPNGDMRLVSNVTAEWARAVVVLNVDYQADMGKVMSALEAAVQQTQDDETVKAKLLETPQATGWVGFNDWAIQVQLTAKTLPGQQWGVMMALRRHAVEALRAAKVRVAVPAQQIQVEHQSNLDIGATPN